MSAAEPDATLGFQLEEPRWRRFGRRALTLPLAYGSLSLVALGLPLWLALAALADLITGGAAGAGQPSAASGCLGYAFWTCLA